MGFFDLKAKQTTDTSKSALESFNPTKKIGNYFLINEDNKQWGIPATTITGKIKSIKVHKYSDIVNFELLEDGNSITKGGLGSAVVGGLAFGGIGAIVGGTTGKKKTKNVCTNMKVKITLNDLNNPVEYINLIESEFKKDGILYKETYKMAQEILSILELICSSNSINNTGNSTSIADEIKKFKDLLDTGAITQEEFNHKKQELLNL